MAGSFDELSLPQRLPEARQAHVTDASQIAPRVTRFESMLWIWDGSPGTGRIRGQPASTPDMNAEPYGTGHAMEPNASGRHDRVPGGAIKCFTRPGVRDGS